MTLNYLDLYGFTQDCGVCARNSLRLLKEREGVDADTPEGLETIRQSLEVNDKLSPEQRESILNDIKWYAATPGM